MSGQTPSNPSQPLAQTIPNIPNLNQSPFPSIQTFMNQGANNRAPTGLGANPASPVSGQNLPNFGGGDQLIQSNNSLISAINQLTQAMSGAAGTSGGGGRGAPVHSIAKQQQQLTFGAAVGSTIGGLKSGTGLGTLISQGIASYAGFGTPNAGPILPNGYGSIAQAATNSAGGFLKNGFRAGAAAASFAGNIGGGIAGASSIPGLFGGLSGIPFVGGLLASLGTPFAIAQGRFAEMSNYEKVATQTSLQLNQAGRNRLDLQPGGVSNFRGMNAMANEFQPLGIGPTEGAGLLGQMLTATGALNGGAFMDVGGRTLPQMMRQGYSANTVGFSQRLRGDIFGNKFMGGSGNDLQLATFGMGRSMGFNDPMQAQFMQDIYSMQINRALSGANTGFDQNALTGALGAFSSLGFGEFSTQAMIQREAKAANLGVIANPLEGLAQSTLNFQFLKNAGFNTLKAKELQENATSFDKFKMLADTRGVKSAMQMMSSDFNTNELKSFKAQYEGANLKLSPFETFDDTFAGNEVAQTNARLEADRVQNRRDVIMKTAEKNQQIENQQLEFLSKNFDVLSKAAEDLAKAQLKLLETTANVVEYLNDLIADIKKRGVGATIKGRTLPEFLGGDPPKKPSDVPKTPATPSKQENDPYEDIQF
jgi:hypothetical protein